GNLACTSDRPARLYRMRADVHEHEVAPPRCGRTGTRLRRPYRERFPPRHGQSHHSHFAAPPQAAELIEISQNLALPSTVSAPKMSTRDAASWAGCIDRPPLPPVGFSIVREQAPPFLRR